ncbi:unnamed protein product [Protopolystoma xenopodis]|uniref:tRNA (uracil-O(2)-)-methyltransferase n=1 Tax=Protopolystoma xenopodis TaxID=117903 RepID=A0A448X3I6_9PLAT|nr:unnamed protein product [Protopolystoma xenopodis]
MGAPTMSSPFDAVLLIWINKPQVLHKLIFGSKVTQHGDKLIKRKIYPKLSTSIEPFDETIEKGIGRILITQIGESESQIFGKDWFISKLQLKLNTWISQRLSSTPSSLKLVDLNLYQLIYRELKKKYGDMLLQNWAEKTDPMKHVFEDLAIAAYLLCLWEKTSQPINFIDIGCGNGLLVFILTSEGHKGIGIDMRRRKSWDNFPNIFREEVILPTSCSGFADVNWLIGNHSDELTPWLPVLALRSNIMCNVFVIPCCPFSLYQKYDPSVVHWSSMSNSINANGTRLKSRYWAYLDYIENLYHECGYLTERDVLRIPSTKKVSLVQFP